MKCENNEKYYLKNSRRETVTFVVLRQNESSKIFLALKKNVGKFIF